MLIADLFCGMGGLSIGFSENGYEVIGYDIIKETPSIFELNNIGNALIVNLSKKQIDLNPDIIIGGPPCRPWSNINLKKRLNNHEDYKLLNVFFKNIIEKKPLAFIMENVAPVKNDLLYNMWIDFLSRYYSIKNEIIKYSDYGAPTRRRRLITAGFLENSAETFFKKLQKGKSDQKTVREAISPYIKIEKNEFPDHEWPQFKTIGKYLEKYKTGEFGWYKLKMNEPAPSFGNVMKTYTLHPLAGKNGFPLRVISVREAMSIMGFNRNYIFPNEMGHTKKYQMIADVVSPIFSKKCALTIDKML